MGFLKAVETGFVKYARFQGRASRSEFWYFTLFQALGMILAMMVSETLQSGAPLLAFVLGTALPSITVAVRRLHDTDRSGWFYLLKVIPVAGDLILLVLFCLPGTAGPNRFDDAPAAPEEPLSPGATRPGL